MEKVEYKWNWDNKKKANTYIKNTQIDERTIKSEVITEEEYYKNKDW